MSIVFTTKLTSLSLDECTYVESTNNIPANHMAQWNLFDAVNIVILKFPADDL